MFRTCRGRSDWGRFFSPPKGALVMHPSTLTNDQSRPLNSSYRPCRTRQSRSKTPALVQRSNQSCAVLPLHRPVASSDFHCEPVRHTKTIAANARRGSVGLRPPPHGCVLRRFGISGSTTAHSSSLTPHRFSWSMPSFSHHTDRLYSLFVQRLSG